jgi:hypothetical protein
MPAISNIDSFTNSYGTYILYYDRGGDVVSVEVHDPFTGSIGYGDFSLVFSSGERGGHSDGDLIYTFNFGGTVTNFYASLTYPYATISHGGSGGTGGGGITCDLAIASIVGTNESVAGAANGTASITATSSALPILYSLDNVNWVSSNVFSGLTGGFYNAYTTDDNGCTAALPFTILTTPPNPYSLTGVPVVNGSRWSAVFNPIVFKYHGPAGTKFRTEITSGYDGAANVITADYTANLNGDCRADISKYLHILLQPKDEFDYSTLNYRDANISASYTVRFCAVTRDADNNEVLSPWQSAGNPFYVTCSAMQIGNPTGGNMLPYVPKYAAGAARFLNDFKIPRFYTDMPFDLSFIYSEEIVGYQIKLGGNGIDVNGNNAGAMGELMLLNENGSVLLNTDGSKLLIEKQAPGVLFSKLGVNRLRITQNIPANSVWLDVFLFYVDTSGNNVQITESRRLLIDSSPCNGLPYEYLKWMGPNGGWLYYMFIKNQHHEIATKSQVLYERYIDDYAVADSTQQQTSIAAQKSVILGANDLSADEADALSTLLYSPKVYRLIDKATNTWQGVIIETNSLKLYQTDSLLGDFEIKILLPEINTQRI